MKTSKKQWTLWIFFVITELLLINACIHVKGRTPQEKLSTTLTAAFSAIHVDNNTKTGLIVSKISESIDFLEQIEDDNTFDLTNAIALIENMDLDISAKHMSIIRVVLASTYFDVGEDGGEYAMALIKGLNAAKLFIE